VTNETIIEDDRYGGYRPQNETIVNETIVDDNRYGGGYRGENDTYVNETIIDDNRYGGGGGYNDTVVDETIVQEDSYGGGGGYREDEYRQDDSVVDVGARWAGDEVCLPYPSSSILELDYSFQQALTSSI